MDIATEKLQPVKIYGYRLNYCKTILVILSILFSCGIFGMVLFWKRIWALKMTHSKCSYQKCTRVLVIDEYGIEYVEKIVDLEEGDYEIIESFGHLRRVSKLKLFCNKRCVYLYLNNDEGKEKFIKSVDWLNHGFCLSFISNALTQETSCSILKNDSLLDYEKIRKNRQLIFGSNTLYIPVPGFFEIMFKEVLTPFYAFQAFSVILWYNDDYWFYATCILLISIITLIKSTYDIRSDRKKLNRNLTIDLNHSPSKKSSSTPPHCKEGMVTVERRIPCGDDNMPYYSSSCCYDIPVTDLVPGDIIRLSAQLIIDASAKTGINVGIECPCDALVLEGAAVINECLLTGESVPVSKSPYRLRENQTTSSTYNCANKNGKNHNRDNNCKYQTTASENHVCDEKLFFYTDHMLAQHFLFCGTKILQIKKDENFYNAPTTANDNCSLSDEVPPYIRAYVVATGFNTFKGKMVLGFLYPAPSLFRFDQDAFKFIAALFGIAAIGFTYSVVLKIIQGVALRSIIIRSLDLIAIVVPPALPAAMTAGLIFAQKRIKRNYKVLTLSPEKINVSGALDVLCFDKTGTLTNDGLDILGALPVLKTKFENKNNVTITLNQNLATSTPQTTTSDGSMDTSFSDDFIPTSSPIMNTTTVNTPQQLRISNLMLTTFETRRNQNDDAIELEKCCAMCHSLNILGAGLNGGLVGDPLEIKMFDFSRWTMWNDQNHYSSTLPDATDTFSVLTKDQHNTPSPTTINYTAKFRYINQGMPISAVFCPPSPYYHNSFKTDNNQNVETSNTMVQHPELEKILAQEPQILDYYGLVHIYPFLPSYQRMSVIVRKFLGPNFVLYTKGAPEVIMNLCVKESLPANYMEKLNELTDDGCRVISCAMKNMTDFKLSALNKLSRKQNKLKASSGPTIQILNKAGFKNVMITGDNMLTALSVARESFILPSMKVFMIETQYVDVELQSGIECMGLPTRLLVICLVEKVFTKHYTDHDEILDNCGKQKNYQTFLRPEELESEDDCYAKLLKILKKSSYVDKTITDAITQQKSKVRMFDPHIFYNRIRQFFSRKHTNIPFSISSSGNDSLCPSINSGKNTPISNFNQTIIADVGDDYTPTYKNFYAMSGPCFEVLDEYQNLLVNLNSRDHSIMSFGNNMDKSFEDNLCPYMFVKIPSMNKTRSSSLQTFFAPKGADNAQVICTNLVLPNAFQIKLDMDRGKVYISNSATQSPKTNCTVGNNLISDCSTTTNIMFQEAMGTNPKADPLNMLLLDECCVFARMTPELKTRLVTKYQALDYYVCMCGDGANDCGALKAAHVGVSIVTPNNTTPSSSKGKNDDIKSIVGQQNVSVSTQGFSRLIKFPRKICRRSPADNTVIEGTASLAAPFTATNGDITCLSGLIREGRASLSTSFGCFKNMACYSLNQFVACLSLYWFITNFSDVEFSYADFFAATLIPMLMGYTQAYPHLATKSRNCKAKKSKSSMIHNDKEANQIYQRDIKLKPDTSLADIRHVGSVIGHIFINVIFMITVILYTIRQPWCLKEPKPPIDHKNPYYTHLVTAIFILSVYQYLIFTIVFSKGKPFRKSYFTNLPQLFITIILVLFTMYLAIGLPYDKNNGVSKFFKLLYPPTITSSIFYLILCLTNLIIALLFERIILDKLLSNYCRMYKRDLLCRRIQPPKYIRYPSLSQYLASNSS